MVKIKLKELEENVCDGYVEFIKKDTGEKCHILLQMIYPEGLIIYPDGTLEIQQRPSFTNFWPDGLKTDELVINITPMFTSLFKLNIDYKIDCIIVKISPLHSSD